MLNDVRNNNSYRKCDISLMYKLFRNACFSLPAPTAGWDKPVPPLAIGVCDDIERIRQTRNKAFGHISSTPVSDADYKQYVKTATEICTRMDTIHAPYVNQSVPGTYLQVLNNIIMDSIDADIYRSYVDVLVRAAKQEEDIIKTVTEISLEAQKSVCQAERSIVSTIKEGGVETRNELSALGRKVTEYFMDTKTRRQNEEEMNEKITKILVLEDDKSIKLKKRR